MEGDLSSRKQLTSTQVHLRLRQPEQVSHGGTSACHGISQSDQALPQINGS
jgi:hypothetical protein